MEMVKLIHRSFLFGIKIDFHFRSIILLIIWIIISILGELKCMLKISPESIDTTFYSIVSGPFIFYLGTD